MIIAGIDYSLTCPAICVHNTDNGPLSFNTCRFYFNQQSCTKKEEIRRNELILDNIFWPKRIITNDEIQRYICLADWAMSVIMLENVNIVSLEAYALGAKGLVFNIAEATGILKYFLTVSGIPYKTFPPTLNKKSFSGKGNANKEKMILSFNEKNSINIAETFGLKKDFTGSPISDIVDSYSLVETYLRSV